MLREIPERIKARFIGRKLLRELGDNTTHFGVRNEAEQMAQREQLLAKQTTQLSTTPRRVNDIANKRS